MLPSSGQSCYEKMLKVIIKFSFGDFIFSFFLSRFSTFKFEQLVLQLGTSQLVDAVRNRVLVVQRLAAGVDDGGAVQQGHVTFAVGGKKKQKNRRSAAIVHFY